MPAMKRRVARKRRTTPKRATWMRDFLAALAETSNVTAAAEKARITLGHVYKTRRTDQAFARKWMSALCEGYDNLELELLHRLRSGATGPEKDRRFDNATAFRLLAAHRDSAARERAIQDNADSERIVRSINEKLELMRQRSIEIGEYVPDEDEAHDGAK